VLQKLKDGLNRGVYRIVGEVEMKSPEDVDRMFRVGEGVVREVLRIAHENPKLIGTILSSLSLSYAGIEVRR